MTLGAVEPKFWAAFCRAAGREDWVARQTEALPQDALRAEIAAWFAAHTGDAIAARFEGVDCCLARVLTLAEAVASPHALARGLVRPSSGGIGHEALFPAVVDGHAPRGRMPSPTRRPASPRR